MAALPAETPTDGDAKNVDERQEHRFGLGSRCVVIGNEERGRFLDDQDRGKPASRKLHLDVGLTAEREAGCYDSYKSCSICSRREKHSATTTDAYVVRQHDRKKPLRFGNMTDEHDETIADQWCPVATILSRYLQK
jgi:hypothetical protein